MSTTITAVAPETGSTTPLDVDGYESNRDRNTIAHVLSRGATVPRFRESSLRKGTLTLLYGTDEAASAAAEALFATRTLFDLTSTDRDSIEMRFFPSGRIGRTLDGETRDVWHVTVEFEEVATP